MAIARMLLVGVMMSWFSVLCRACFVRFPLLVRVGVGPLLQPN